MYEMSLHHPTWGRLPEVTCPVVVARGKRIPRTPADIALRIVERLPAGRLEAFDDLGHMGPLEAPARIAAHIQAFFDEVG